MPLLRRNSNKSSKDEAGSGATESSHTKTSLFGRLSGRRRSSSTGSGNAASQSGLADDGYFLHGQIGSHDAESSIVGGSGSSVTGSTVSPHGSELSEDPKSHTNKYDSGDVQTHRRDSGDQNDGHELQHHRSSSHHRKSSSHERSQHKHKTEKSGIADEPAHIEGGLNKDDVQSLFHGAPHFMLEKGRRGRYFPQTFFPWNSTLEISDLQDRLYLKHESFALSTLHAHLPITDEINWKPGMEHPSHKEGLETGKRPMFDLGIYERPNMLGLAGKEPGTIGFRFFLEVPVSDGLAEEKKAKASAKSIDLEHISALEALEVLSHEQGDAKIGKQAPLQDRVSLAREGNEGWKKVGVRHISTKAITERLELICSWRDEIVNAGWKVTVLDKLPADQLAKHLFGELLYPPPKLAHHHKEQDLKVQIEALVKVLTTPGAWLDFSLPKERLLFGHVINDRDYDQVDKKGVKQGTKRKWALVQLLLAIELVIRLDAALRLGVAQHSREFHITSEEIHHFNKLRNLKVDWDLVVARRFLDLCYVRKVRDIKGLGPEPSHERKQSQHHFLGHFKHNAGMEETEDDEFDCAILPRQPQVMVEGLIRFADHIGWPNVKQIEQTLRTKICGENMEQILTKGIATIDHPHVGHSILESTTIELRAATEDTVGGPLSHTWLSSLVVPGYTSCDLLIATLLENDPSAISKLGSIAYPRAGFILDGLSWWSKVCVISRVLAPKRIAQERMGWSGFPESLLPVTENGERYGNGWKVITRELTSSLEARDARIYSGDRVAKESSPLGVGHGRVLSNEFSMITDQILEGLATVDVKDMRLVLSKTKTPPEGEEHDAYDASVHFDISTLSTSEPQLQTLKFPLKYAVRFVSGHPCRLPHGHTTQRSRSNSESAPQAEHHHHPQHRRNEQLPSHPLHNSYKYETISIQDLLDPNIVLPDGSLNAKPQRRQHEQQQSSNLETSTAPSTTDQTADSQPPPTSNNNNDKDDDNKITQTTSASAAAFAALGISDSDEPLPPSPVWIIDARGFSPDRDILVRAWCAMVGRDAIIARVGKCCLSCVIREARALDVGVVIRVGEGV